MLSLSRSISSEPTSALYNKLRDLILSTQYSNETRHALEAISKSALPPFPQTALVKLKALLSIFPPPDVLEGGQLTRLLMTIHPTLCHASFQAWAILGRQTQDIGLGHVKNILVAEHGLLGYELTTVKRLTIDTAEVTFVGASGSVVTCTVPAGPRTMLPYPISSRSDFHVTERFIGLLTSFVQAHALGWDISFIPPAQPSTASSSTSTLLRVFSQILGYETEVVHMYKELGGRELVMRRRILDGGATTWEPRYPHVLLSSAGG